MSKNIVSVQHVDNTIGTSQHEFSVPLEIFGMDKTLEMND